MIRRSGSIGAQAWTGDFTSGASLPAVGKYTTMERQSGKVCNLRISMKLNGWHGNRIPKFWRGLYPAKIKSSILNSESYLDLSYQRISDLSPLRKPLTFASSTCRQINHRPFSIGRAQKPWKFFILVRTKSRILALDNLFELKELYLDDNPLNNLSVIENLTRLQILNVADTGLALCKACLGCPHWKSSSLGEIKSRMFNRYPICESSGY